SRNGLQMLADGGEPDMIRSVLEVEMAAAESKDLQAAKVWEGFGGYSPTIGIIGAVMGLIHVMNNLADPSSLGPGIAVAFVATIYGVGLANLFFLPTASKLKSIVNAQTQYREMIVDGLVSIAEGENPRNIDSKLKGYIYGTPEVPWPGQHWSAASAAVSGIPLVPAGFIWQVLLSFDVLHIVPPRYSSSDVPNAP